VVSISALINSGRNADQDGPAPAPTVAQAAALLYGAKVKIVAIAAKEAPTPD
jgi:hypothetical protein